MPLFEYGIAVLARSMFDRQRTSGLEACRTVARGDRGDARTGCVAGKYAAITWFIVAGVSLIAWMVVAVTARVAFGVSGFHSTGVQIMIRALTGLIVGSMILVGIVVSKAPGRYNVNGCSTYVERRFGPSPIDFWIGVAIAVAAALSL